MATTTEYGGQELQVSAPPAAGSPAHTHLGGHGPLVVHPVGGGSLPGQLQQLEGGAQQTSLTNAGSEGTERFAETATLAITSIVRFAELATLDAPASQRFAETATLAATSTQRFAEIATLQNSGSQRFAETTTLDKGEVGRRAESATLEAHVLVRFAELTTLEASNTIRFAESASLEATLSARVAQISELEATDQPRLANISTLESQSSDRFASNADLTYFNVARFAQFTLLQYAPYDGIGSSDGSDSIVSITLSPPVSGDVIPPATNTVLDTETIPLTSEYLQDAPKIATGGIGVSGGDALPTIIIRG